MSLLKNDGSIPTTRINGQFVDLIPVTGTTVGTDYSIYIEPGASLTYPATTEETLVDGSPVRAITFSGTPTLTGTFQIRGLSVIPKQGDEFELLTIPFYIETVTYNLETGEHKMAFTARKLLNGLTPAA